MVRLVEVLLGKMSGHRGAKSGPVFAALVVALGVVWQPAVGQASPIWEWAGSPTSGQAHSGRLTAQGAEAAYYNPSRLVDQKRGATFGTSMLAGALRVDLDDRPAGIDISEEIYDARVPDGQGGRQPPEHRPLATDELPNRRGSSDPSFAHPYISMGAVVPVIENRLAIGFFATLSADEFAGQRPHYVDEREQYFSNSLHFERLGDRLVGSHFAGGAGVRITDEVRVGLGASIAQDAASQNEMFSPDPTRPDRSDVNTSVSVDTRFVPHVGVDVRPGDDWRVAATVHAPYGNRVDGTSEIRFWNFPVGPDEDGVVDQELSYLYDFEPLRIGVGASRRWGGEQRGVEAGLQLVYERWSGYVDRQGEAPVDTWSDIATPTATLAVDRGDTRWDGDLQFSPSPVPEQDGRSNYVDNSRWVASGGYSRTFEVLETDLEVGVHSQVQWLVRQRADKSREATDPVFDEFPESSRADDPDETIEESLDFRTNNPGYPGYSATGLVVGAGVTVSSKF